MIFIKDMPISLKKFAKVKHIIIHHFLLIMYNGILQNIIKDFGFYSPFVAILNL